jgi:uncharacterized protein YkwD
MASDARTPRIHTAAALLTLPLVKVVSPMLHLPAPIATIRRLAIAGTVILGLTGAAVTIAPAAQAAPAAATVTSHPVVAQHELDLLNSERTAHGLPKLTMNTHLLLSSSRHSVDMANANSMSHQLPGEKAFGARLDSAGYDWSTAGENVGYTTTMTSAGARTLETMMYNEVAPNNGHRLNILSTAFKNVGISVLTDTTHHRLWITEDFGHTM